MYPTLHRTLATHDTVVTVALHPHRTKTQSVVVDREWLLGPLPKPVATCHYLVRSIQKPQRELTIRSLVP